uniref:C-CAP/cofactor C-like domain-containing protein n=1 Tax=Strongyloides stercoralis TaxID=6248 RepID=A0A0K0DSR1_STRER
MKIEKSYLWPRGDFSMITDHSYISFGSSNVDTFKLALQFVSYHGYFNGTLYITYPDWHRIAIQKMLLTEDVAVEFFITAKHLEEMDSENEKSVISKEELMEEVLTTPDISLQLKDLDGNKVKLGKINILFLALVIVMSGYQEFFPTECRNVPSFKTVCEYIKVNLKQFCSILLLCNPNLMKKLIKEPHRPVECIDDSTKIHIEHLHNFNYVFEGTIINLLETINERTILPQKCWHILSKKIVTTFYRNEIRFDEVIGTLDMLLQQDMFAVHDLSYKCTENDKERINNFQQCHKKFTPSLGAKYRKLVIVNWNHIELFTSPLYKGINLKLSHGTNKSSYIFFPQYARSVVISNTKDCLPIILGPVKDIVFMNNVHNTSISVITHRIIIKNCSNLTIFLSSYTPPIISRDCKDINLAPYNVFYTDLENQLKMGQMSLLSIDKNQWSKPLILDELFPQSMRNKKTLFNEKSPHIHQILPVSSFYIQPTIFNMNFKSPFFKYFRSKTIPSTFIKSWEGSLTKIYQKDPHPNQIYDILTKRDIQYLFKKFKTLLYRKIMVQEGENGSGVEESLGKESLDMTKTIDQINDLKNKELEVENKKRHLEELKNQLKEKQTMIDEITKLSKQLDSEPLTEDGKLTEETISRVRENLENALISQEKDGKIIENSNSTKKEGEKMDLAEAVKYLEIKLSSDNLLSNKNKEQIEHIQATVKKIKENEKRLRDELEKRMKRRDEIVKELAKSQETMKIRMKNIEDLKAQLAAIKQLKEKKEKEQGDKNKVNNENVEK